MEGAKNQIFGGANWDLKGAKGRKTSNLQRLQDSVTNGNALGNVFFFMGNVSCFNDLKSYFL